MIFILNLTWECFADVSCWVHTKIKKSSLFNRRFLTFAQLEQKLNIFWKFHHMNGWVSPHVQNLEKINIFQNNFRKFYPMLKILIKNLFDCSTSLNEQISSPLLSSLLLTLHHNCWEICGMMEFLCAHVGLFLVNETFLSFFMFEDWQNVSTLSVAI